MIKTSKNVAIYALEHFVSLGIEQSPISKSIGFDELFQRYICPKDKEQDGSDASATVSLRFILEQLRWMLFAPSNSVSNSKKGLIVKPTEILPILENYWNSYTGKKPGKEHLCTLEALTNHVHALRINIAICSVFKDSGCNLTHEDSEYLEKHLEVQIQSVSVIESVSQWCAYNYQWVESSDCVVLKEHFIANLALLIDCDYVLQMHQDNMDASNNKIEFLDVPSLRQNESILFSIEQENISSEKIRKIVSILETDVEGFSGLENEKGFSFLKKEQYKVYRLWLWSDPNGVKNHGIWVFVKIDKKPDFLEHSWMQEWGIVHTTYCVLYQRAYELDRDVNLNLAYSSSVEQYHILEGLFLKNKQASALMRLDNFLIVHSNEAFASLVELGEGSKQSINGSCNILDYFSDSDKIIFLGNALANVLESGYWQGEIGLLTHSSKRLKVLMSLTKIVGSQGQDWVGLFVTDITEKRREQEKIQQMALIAERSTSLTLILDVKGTIEWMNSAFCHTLDVLPEQLLGTDFLNLIEPGQHAAIGLLKSALYSGIGTKLKVKMSASAGRSVWLNVEVSSFNVSNSGRKEFIVVAQDVSIQKELDDKMDRYESVLESVQSILIDQALNEEQRIERILHIAKDYFGVRYAHVGLLSDPYQKMLTMEYCVNDDQVPVLFKQGDQVELTDHLGLKVAYQKEFAFLMYPNLMESTGKPLVQGGVHFNSYMCARIDNLGHPYALVTLYDQEAIEVRGGLASGVLRLISQSIGQQLHQKIQTWSLRTQVQERTEELERSNKQLQQTIKSMGGAQQHLKQKHSTLTLGSLVNGLTHELMGPVGNARLVNDGLGSLIKDFGQLIGKSSIARSDLMQFDQKIKTAQNILELSLERTAELLRAFKGLSQEESKDELRNVKVQDVLNDVYITMGTSLKKYTFMLYLDPAVKHGKQNRNEDLIIVSYSLLLKKMIVNMVTFLSLLKRRHRPKEMAEAVLSAQDQDGWIQIEIKMSCQSLMPLKKEDILEYFYPQYSEYKSDYWDMALCASLGRELLEEHLLGMFDIELKKLSEDGFEVLNILVKIPKSWQDQYELVKNQIEEK